MEIVLKEEGKPTRIAIEGRLDTNTSPQLEEYANNLYAKGVNDIVVDMSRCEFVSSAGLRVIVAMPKRATTGGSLVFVRVVPDVMDVFVMTGFDRILQFEE